MDFTIAYPNPASARAHFAALACALTCTLVTASARPAGAGGYVITEVGNRRTAMAAVVGRPDDASAVVHNPAGLALLTGTRLAVSIGGAAIRTRFRLAAWPDSSELLMVEPNEDGYYAPVGPNRAAAAVPFVAATAELWRGRVFAAVSAHVSNATGSAFDSDAVTRYHLIEGYLIVPVASVSLAYRFGDRGSVGLTAGRANPRLRARRNVYPRIDGNDVSGIIGSSPLLSVDGSDWVTTWGVGALVWPTPRISIGGSLAARVDATLEGPLTLRYGSDAPDPQTLDGYHRTNYLIPWTAALGANADITPRIEIGLEARYWRYRDYQQQRSDVDGIFLVRELVVEKQLDDAYQVSGGVRVHGYSALRGVELMAGAHYDTAPNPTRTLTLDQPSFDNVGVHAGARLQLGRYRAGLSYVHLHYRVPTVTDSITSPPSNFEGSGGTHLLTLSLEIGFGR